jgi:hypothetical protein
MRGKYRIQILTILICVFGIAAGVQAITGERGRTVIWFLGFGAGMAVESTRRLLMATYRWPLVQMIVDWKKVGELVNEVENNSPATH